MWSECYHSRCPVHLMKPRTTLLVLLSLATLLCLLCAAHGTALVRSDDAWMHLAIGRVITQQGALPEKDMFLNSGEPAPWTIHSWLSEVIYHQVMQAGELPLLLGLRGVLVAATLVSLLLLLVRLGSPPWLAALLCCLVLLAPGIRVTLMRPLLFSHLLVVVFLTVLYQVRAGRLGARALWALPALMVLWANLHAGHLVGVPLVFLLVLAALADRLLRRQGDGPGWRTVALLAAATLAASLVNPYVHRIWAYALGFTGGGAYQGQVWEWVPAAPSREPLLFVFLGAAWLVALLRVRRADPFHLLVVVLLTLLPLAATRFLFHGAVGAALALAEGLPALAAGIKSKRLRRLVPYAGTLLAVVSLAALTWTAVAHKQAFAFKVDDSFFPVAAVRFLNDNHLEGKILNLREWGGYLMWHRPGKKVFVDGRVAVSAGAVIRDYVAVAEARRGFGTVLDRRRVELIITSYNILRPEPGFDFQPVAKDRNWVLVYFDDVALIYARASPRNRELIRRHGYATLIPSSSARPFRRGATAPRAEAESRRALALTPSRRAATYLGRMLMRRGAHEEAEQQLRVAVKLSQGSAQALHNLGVAVMRQGDRARAREIFLRVLKLDPEHKIAPKLIELLDSK